MGERTYFLTWHDLLWRSHYIILGCYKVLLALKFQYGDIFQFGLKLKSVQFHSMDWNLGHCGCKAQTQLFIRHLAPKLWPKKLYSTGFDQHSGSNCNLWDNVTRTVSIIWLCSMSLCWISLCWVLLLWVSLWRVLLCWV